MSEKWNELLQGVHKWLEECAHLIRIFIKVEKMDGEILIYANTDRKLMSVTCCEKWKFIKST